MKGSLELPNTYVTWPEAKPSSGFNYSPNTYIKNMPPHLSFQKKNGIRKVYANGEKMFPLSSAGDVEGVLKAAFDGFNGLSAADIYKQLKMHADAQNILQQHDHQALGDSFGVKKNGFTQVLYSSAWWHQHSGTFAPQESAAHDFYGTALMPIAGIYYWLWGQGKTRYVNIGSLNLSMVASDFSPMIETVNKNGPGVYTINKPFTYNAFRFSLNLWAAGLLGRVSGNVNGTLNISANGSWSFDGAFTLNPDTYDSDHSNRTYMQESLTNFLRYLGDKFGHADYQIVVRGSQKIQFSGRK